jgi:hypothetical protein
VDLVPWNDPTLLGSKRGRALAIVGTGPSWDSFDRSQLAGVDAFALNSAITELCRRGGEDTYWVCHDLPKIWKHGFRAQLGHWKRWRLVTRRAYLPGDFGAVPYMEHGERINQRIGGGLRAAELSAPGTWYWYTEFPDLPGAIHAEQTVLEVALDVATGWGYSPIYLVGIDMGAGPGGSLYGRSWKWKPCRIREGKFAAMREALTRNRPRWPEAIYTLSPNWSGPFSRSPRILA